MASLLSLYRSFSSVHNRLNLTAFDFHSGHCRRLTKLYLITPNYLPLKPRASARSLKAVSKRRKCQASSGVSAPVESQRVRIFHDSSKDTSREMKDLEIELEELFNEVKTMVQSGNTDDAADLLRANYEAVKEELDVGLKGHEQAALLDVIALGYMALGDVDFVQHLLDTMDEILDNLKDDEPLLDSILIHVASMYSTLGKFDKAVLAYHRVINIFERVHGENSSFLITPLLGLAKVFGSIGRATKAIQVYHRTISIMEMGRGPESEDLVVPLLSLGKLLMKEGKAIDAESSFVRILRIYTKLYGEKDGGVAMAMCSLAHAKCGKGAADEAIDLYKNALRIIKDSNYMAADDSIMENMRIDLAELLHVAGRRDEGREILEECLLITEKFKGKDHPSIVTHLLNLATSYSRSKNFAEAEHLLRTSLEIMAKKVGPEDPSITFPKLQLAVTLYQMSRDEEAEQLALEVLRVREMAFGKDSLPVGEALDCLVSIHTRLGRNEASSLTLLRRVLAIQEKEFGKESQEVLLTLQKIMFYLDKLGRKDEKFAVRRRLSLLREKLRQTVHY